VQESSATLAPASTQGGRCELLLAVTLGVPQAVDCRSTRTFTRPDAPVSSEHLTEATPRGVVVEDVEHHVDVCASRPMMCAHAIAGTPKGPSKMQLDAVAVCS